MIMLTHVGQNGQITIPASVRRAANIKPGHAFEVEVTDEGILLRPTEIDPDQAWFWTPEWQAKEHEADQAIAEGRFTRYYSEDDFLASFK